MSWEKQKQKYAKMACEFIRKTEALKFGEFILTSGKKSPFYIDMRLFISYPDIFDKLCEIYAKIIRKEIAKVDRIAGIPTAGLPIATLTSYKLHLPMIYVRKEPKPHGKSRMIEGILNPNDSVVLVDDLITSGKSLINAAKAIREEGGTVEHAVTLLDRQQGGRENLGKERIELHTVISIDQLLETLQKTGYIDEKDYQKAKKYITEEKIPAD
ncbi:MAG: orotate phosphoribosyltransferase [Candidatus Jordarchaeaceae archaeon]